MRILHIVPSYIPAYRYGGPIRSVHGLCRALAARGHDVHVFTTNVDGENDSDVPLETPVDIEGVKVWYFPSRFMRRLYWSPLMQRALSHQLKNFDLVHLHSIFLSPTWAAARGARQAQVPYIIAPRGMLVKELIRRKSFFAKTVWISLLEKRNLEAAAAIHVTSRNEAADVARFGFSLKKVVIVPNGIDVPPEGASGDDISTHIKEIIGKRQYLLFLGRINWKKGLDRLIPALSYVPDIHLVIAGNDDENYTPVLETLASENGVTERITFAGTVLGADKDALLRHTSLLVLPSYSENFGIVVLEAMAVGCPVAVTPEVGAAEIVRETGSGMVINGEPGALGNGIKDLLSDSERVRQMAKNGKKAVKEWFSWEAIALRMESVYQDIRVSKSKANT